MPTFTAHLPLSLYIHLPWCVQKCPYCDFNSHELKDNLPEALYVNSLMRELDHHLPLTDQRPIHSIFFGGGTPSLFSAQAIEQILNGIQQRVQLADGIEITLEANPGTTDQVRFKDFHHAGINRLSIGLQSLQDDKLKRLGRIHDSNQAKRAITQAVDAGFHNFNVDLMFGLPDQTLDDAMLDLEQALAFTPPHLSWYQLTIEPNTVFYKQRPILPDDDATWEMQLAGQALLKQHGLQQYEVSAYAATGKQCAHNLNYWQFGDYLGIGAGAHSKITLPVRNQVIRFAQVKQPRDYLDRSKQRIIQLENNNIPTLQTLTESDLIFEFMLNALRLTDGVPASLFVERTGLNLDYIATILFQAKKRGLITADTAHICPSENGKRFLNDLVGMFL